MRFKSSLCALLAAAAPAGAAAARHLKSTNAAGGVSNGAADSRGTVNYTRVMPSEHHPAAAASRLLGLSADQAAHALALSLGDAGRMPWPTLAGGHDGRALAIARAVVAGVEAAEMALHGATGPLDTLDAEEGWFAAAGVCRPLRGALGAFGQAWVGASLRFKLDPGPWATLVPVQAVAEILRRHVKAADKKLRPDQVEGIQVRCGLPAWGADHLAGDVYFRTSHRGHNLQRALVQFQLCASIEEQLPALTALVQKLS